MDNMDILKETLAVTYKEMSKKEIAQHLINVAAIERFQKTQKGLMKIYTPDKQSRTHISKIMRMVEGTKFEVIYVLNSFGVVMYGDYWGLKTRITDTHITLIDKLLDTFLELTWNPMDRVPKKDIKKIVNEHFEVADEILTQQQIRVEDGSYVGVRLV